ncbi:MAG: hypothetical protein ABMA26_13110 [Limisphaerales bacterium]
MKLPINPGTVPPDSGPLPCSDTKPVGAADFYFAINATFRFVLRKLGADGLRRYWMEMGTHYFAPVTARWRSGGAPAIAAHWRAFFAAEPGAEVEVSQTAEVVTLDVKVCPAIKHLREHGREIVPCFCQHCHFISEAIAGPAGFTVRVSGGNGSCRQTFHRRDAQVPAQDLAQIAEVTC